MPVNELYAAGEEKSGYKDVCQAATQLGKLEDTVYNPIQENVEIYEELFKEYQKLYEYFGTGKNNVMKKLKKLKTR